MWSAVVDFMCQFDWAMGCLDIWSNIFLGVSVRVFRGEVNIQINSLSKALPNMGGSGWAGVGSREGSSNPLKA